MIGTHPKRGTLLAFEHLQGWRRRRVGDHLAACAPCRARLAGMRAVREAAAEATDARPARDLWPAIEARLDEGHAVILPAATGGAAVRRGLPRSAAAAVVALLVFAGLAAAAVVLTPLGRYFGRSSAPARQVAPAAVGSLEVEVPRGGLTVAFPDATDDFRLRIVVREGGLLALVPGGGAAGLAFRSGAARVEVTGAGLGTLEVRVPTTASAVRLTARGRTIAVVRDGSVRVARRENASDLSATVGELLRASGGLRP